MARNESLELKRQRHLVGGAQFAEGHPGIVDAHAVQVQPAAAGQTRQAVDAALAVDVVAEAQLALRGRPEGLGELAAQGRVGIRVDRHIAVEHHRHDRAHVPARPELDRHGERVRGAADLDARAEVAQGGAEVDRPLADGGNPLGRNA